MSTVPLLGVAFDDMSLSDAARWIASRPEGALFGYVVTPNADHLVRLARAPALRSAYEAALLRLFDSRAVALSARALGLPKPAVVTGSELAAELLRNHLRPGERITIVGLKAAFVPALMARCNLAPPAHYEPPVGFEQDPAELAKASAFVAAHPARFIFLAVGSPRQEIIAVRIAAEGRATGTALCIGAGLEFLAGARRRAPRWMQQAGLEWSYRLASEPRRLARRYLVDCPAVLPMLVRERLALQASAAATMSASRS